MNLLTYTRNHIIFKSGSVVTPSAEYWTGAGWQYVLPNLPNPVQRHCMLRTGATQVMVIGGVQDNTPSLYSKTFIYETANQTWFSGPELNVSRFYHNCGRILRSEGSSEFSIVVTGGQTITNSCEIVDFFFRKI